MNIGIIGTGGISAAHAMGINSLDDSVARLHSCCDLNEQARQKFISKYPCKSYECIDQMLKDNELDSVIVCLPHGLHTEIGIKAMEAGKHVLVEKPMGPNVSDCRKLLDAAERTAKKLQVGHEYYLYPTIQKAREIIDTGELGKPLMLTGEISSYIYDKLGTWWMDPEKAKGGPGINMGVHMIDVASYILNKIPKAVRGEARELHSNAVKGIEDYLRIELNFGNSVYADFRIYSFLQKIDIIKPGINIFCEKGYLSVWSNKLSIQHSDGDLECILKGDPSKAYLVFAEQVKLFSEYIKGRRAPRSSGDFGMMTVACVEGAIKNKRDENWNLIKDITGAAK